MSSSINNISKQSSFESFSWDKVKDELAQIGRDISATVDSIDFKEWIVGDFSKPQVTPLEDFFITKLKNRFSSLGEFVFTIKGWAKDAKVIKGSSSYSYPSLDQDQCDSSFMNAYSVYEIKEEHSTLVKPIPTPILQGLQEYSFIKIGEFSRREIRNTKFFYKAASFPNSLFSDMDLCERTLTTVIEKTEGPEVGAFSLSVNKKTTEKCNAL